MPSLETSTRKIIARLEREGWILEDSKEHAIFHNVDFPGMKLVIPRHRVLSQGVARDIAKKAKW